MRCSISAASSVRPSLRANSARLLSSRIAFRMSVMLCGSRRLIAPPFVDDRLALSRLPATATNSTPSLSAAAEQLVSQPHHRVVLTVGGALLQRDQRIVGDLDVLGAHLGAALGDVAEAE